MKTIFKVLIALVLLIAIFGGSTVRNVFNRATISIEQGVDNVKKGELSNSPAKSITNFFSAGVKGILGN